MSILTLLGLNLYFGLERLHSSLDKVVQIISPVTEAIVSESNGSRRAPLDSNSLMHCTRRKIPLNIVNFESLLNQMVKFT